MNDYQPLLDLLTGKFGWLTTVLIWIGALRLPMKLVSARLQLFLTRFVADVVASPEADDDAALRRVLGSMAYRFAAFALDAGLSLKLPTSESLDKSQISNSKSQIAEPGATGESAANSRISELLLITCLASLVTFLGGCVAQQPPPSGLEQKLFTVQTNYLPVVLLQTNSLPTTNLVAQYTFSPNTNAAAIAQTVGNIGGFWGVGGIAGTVAGALFSLWAWYRSRQAGLSADTLAQVIETGRQILLSLPNGEQYDEAWKTWMIQHQAEAGVIEEVAQIVGNVVDTDSARGAAQGIVDLIETSKGN